MIPKYRIDKATQAASLLLTLRGGTMSHLKLMKLLYLADRAALLKWRRPITFDRFVSMPHGPVLSQTLNAINGDLDGDDFWKRHISSPLNYEVRLLSDPGLDRLSDAEENLLREIFQLYGRMGRFELRDLTHDLPEWQDPDGSSVPIRFEDILRLEGKTAVEIKSIMDEFENIALLDDYMGH